MAGEEAKPLKGFLQRLFGKRTADEQPSAKTEHTVSEQVTGVDTTDDVSSDAPISKPEQDRLGFDPFAKAIARSISRTNASEGLVYAINGAWGAGKSSAINLILHHLEPEVGGDRLQITMFNPWWFSGSEALTISFFQELRASIGSTLGDQAQKIMANIGSRVSSAGPLLGGLTTLFSLNPAAGAAVAGGATMLEKLTKIDSTVENEHRKLAESLRLSNKKFLVVLDDIDRLSTDEALQIFKLIKSVGRLPNVIYLLAFDRTLAEKMVAERFPAEGVSFLEKVIQGGFDLPEPDREDLKNQLLRTVESVMGAPSEEALSRFWNIFLDIAAPLIKTPRDTVRLGNAIAVAWPAIAEEVDRADFLAIEALRVFLPEVYRAIRLNSDLLVNSWSGLSSDKSEKVKQADEAFLINVESSQRPFVKRALRRLFPRLDSIWANTLHGDGNHWQRERRVCSPVHFPTYFAFGVTASGITAEESKSLVEDAGRPGAVSSHLRRFLQMRTRKGGTRAALALDDIIARAEDVPEANVVPLLKDLFAVADELNIKADEAGAFSIGDNQLRLHWILNRLLRERFELDRRSHMIRDAAESASLEWLISLADRCSGGIEKLKKEGDDSQQMVDEATADWISQLATDKLRTAAASGELAQHPRLVQLLFRWKERTSVEEIRAWTDDRLAERQFIIRLCRDLPRTSWSHSMGFDPDMGDRAATKFEYVHLAPLAPLMDTARLRTRVDEMLTEPSGDPDDITALRRFADLPDRDPGRHR